jgi:hypothetical protein
MAPTTHRSRIHLLAAKEAPTVVILQRKRAKLFHVITVNTEKHWVKEGSWFRGRLYEMKCDVSFDGEFMVYLALGASGDAWSGLCRLPWLKTLAESESAGTSWGGGYFPDRDILITNGWCRKQVSPAADIPLTLTSEPLTYFASEARGILYKKFERDGFARLGDDVWGKRPSLHHPELKVRYLGYEDHGDKFAFSLDAYPAVVEGANWVTWDSGSTLWVARPGVVEQFTLEDMQRGAPSFSLDVDRFEPPPKPVEEP